MKSKSILIGLLVVLAFGLWSCEDVTPSTPGGGGGGGGTGTTTRIARITGQVHDGNGIPIYNAKAYRVAPGVVDSTTTDANGQFHFEVVYGDPSDSIVTSVTVRKHGYLDNVKTLTVVAGFQYNLDYFMVVDLSTSAVISGAVRDSSTLYPLRSSLVIYSVPGFSDQVVTGVDGMFTFIVDLVDVSTLPVNITISHAGYQTKAVLVNVNNGQSYAIGDVLLQEDQGSTVGTVLGRILDGTTRLPLVNANVTLTSSLVTDSVFTSGDGAYSFSINLQGLTDLSGQLKVTKSGYRTRTTAFAVSAGSSAYYDILLDRDTTTGVNRDSGTGDAHSISLISVSSKEIAVYGVGGLEAATIIWEVRDSLGFPIDIDHRDTVTFELLGVPVLGGAYASPSAAITNVSGRVAATINSGTVAGALQFVAKLHRESDGLWVESRPVVITVNAGLPDQTHFSVGAAQYNFAGYDWINRTNTVLVQVGDKYSNPVKTGTAVYFATTGGVIQASGFTDASSHATVTLFSGNPQPSDLLLGPGFAHIAASTLGENGVTISDEIVVLFSATAQISNVNPVTFAVPANGSSGPINYRVSDRFGNPLAPGTRIRVTLQYTPPPNSQLNFTVTGDVDITMGDTQAQGPGTTQFTFQVVDQTGATHGQVPVTAVIHTEGPNGTPANFNVVGTIGSIEP